MVWKDGKLQGSLEYWMSYRTSRQKLDWRRICFLISSASRYRVFFLACGILIGCEFPSKKQSEFVEQSSQKDGRPPQYAKQITTSVGNFLCVCICIYVWEIASVVYINFGFYKIGKTGRVTCCFLMRHGMWWLVKAART